MAGHSQFKNIMHKKGRADAARSKLFERMAQCVPDPREPSMVEHDQQTMLAQRTHTLVRYILNAWRAVGVLASGEARGPSTGSVRIFSPPSCSRMVEWPIQVTLLPLRSMLLQTFARSMPDSTRQVSRRR